MIKEIKKQKDVAVHKPQSYKKESYIVYECSDGKQFTNENDDRKGYKTGKQLANEYEEGLRLENIAKEELKFHSISNNKHNNNEYESEFCFYYHPNLSKETKNTLFSLVYELKGGEDMQKMKEGWYLVEQSVYEVDSCSRNCKYECNGYFGLLSDLIEMKEKILEQYKLISESVTNKLNK